MTITKENFVTMISQEAFLKAWNNKKLVAGALKAAHVYPGFSYYEDYLQEGIVLYAQMLEKYADMSQKEVDKLSFRKIIWYVIDQLRKCQRDSENCQKMNEVLEIVESKSIDVILFLQEVFPTCSSVEKLLIKDHFLQGEKITKISERTGIARRTLQRNKKALKEKLRVDLLK